MTKPIPLIISLFLILLSQRVYSQLGINTENPDTSSELHIYSTDKGILIPRVDLTASLSDPSPVSSPAEGLLIYNIGSNAAKGFYFWKPTSGWTLLGTDNLGNHSLSQNLSTNDYWISNDGTDQGINITSTGRLGIGTSQAQKMLDVETSDPLDGAKIGSAFIGNHNYSGYAQFRNYNAPVVNGWAIGSGPDGDTYFNCASGQYINFEYNNGNQVFARFDNDNITFNYTGNNRDLIIKNESSTTLFRADASASSIGIGQDNPVERLDIQDDDEEGALRIGEANNANAGTIQWDGSHFQGHNGSQWVNLDTGGAGSGVSGPASSTDNAIARFDGTTGDIIKNSGVTINDNNHLAGIEHITVGNGIREDQQLGILNLGLGSENPSFDYEHLLNNYNSLLFKGNEEGKNAILGVVAQNARSELTAHAEGSNAHSQFVGFNLYTFSPSDYRGWEIGKKGGSNTNTQHDLHFRYDIDGSTERFVLNLDTDGYVSFENGIGVNAILDEDDLSSNSETALASQQSIKAYIDNQTSGIETNKIYEGNSQVLVTDNGSDGTLSFVTEGTELLSINNETISIPAFDNTSGSTTPLKFKELQSNGTNSVGFKAPDNITSDVIWVLPRIDGDNGDVLSTDGNGVLEWSSGSSSLEILEDGSSISSNVDEIDLIGAAKVSDEGSGDVSVLINACIQCSSSSSINVGTSSPTAVPWNQESFKESDYFQHSNSSSNTRIYVQQTAWYEVSYNIVTEKEDNNTRSNLRSRIRINGTDYEDLGTAFSYSRNDNNPYASNTAGTVLIYMEDDDYLEILCDRAGDNADADLIPDNSHIYIKLIRAD